jgi:hypothetical protein
MVERTDCLIPYEAFHIGNPVGTIHICKLPNNPGLVLVQVSSEDGMFEGHFTSLRVAWREANNHARRVLGL